MARHAGRARLIAGLGVTFGSVLLVQMAGVRPRETAEWLWLLGALGGALLVWAAWAMRRVLRRQRDTEAALLCMSPAAFEQHVAALFAREGFESRRVGASSDGGVDVHVQRRGRRGIVQCKRYRADRAIGPATIRELVGARAHERADMVWLATTGRITRGAQQLAAEEGVALLDAAALASWASRLRGRRRM